MKNAFDRKKYKKPTLSKKKQAELVNELFDLVNFIPGTGISLRSSVSTTSSALTQNSQQTPVYETEAEKNYQKRDFYKEPTERKEITRTEIEIWIALLFISILFFISSII